MRIFLDKEDDRVIGFGVIFTEEDLFKFGAPSEHAVDIEMDMEHHIVGFYGSHNAEFITQLGIVIQDVNCTVAKAEELLMSGVTSQINVGGEEDGGGVFLLITIICVVIVLVITVVVITMIFLKKLSLKKMSRVQVLSKTEENRPPSGINNTSQPN